MSLYEKIAALPLRIEGLELEGLSQKTSSGWTRRSTELRLIGAGHEGRGEDVTYQEADQALFQERGPGEDLRGDWTLASFSRGLDAAALFAAPPADPKARLFRRWAFESAALDLALRQADLSLAAALGRAPRPLSFVVSLGLGRPPSTRAIEELRGIDAGLGFKLDATAAWDEALIARLRALGGVACVDLKGRYSGPFTGEPPDPALARRVAEGLPEAWIEDPADEVLGALAGHEGRITYDAPICSVADLLTHPGKAVNMKPSRFGFLAELLRAYEYCERAGVRMYGGGQFELGVGRTQAQALAALFHPDGANDLAPSGFNQEERPAGLPSSPLAPKPEAPGFR